MYESILRAPDLILWQTETDEYKRVGTSGIASESDVTICCANTADGLRVSLTAVDTPVRMIRLRWKFHTRLKGLLLGDAWERGYGDMAWNTVLPYRAMPWYFLVNEAEETAGYGVKVRAGALCYWQVDPVGVSLWLDVRNGGAGVILGGRTLEAATVVFERYTDRSAFEAGRAFCRRMADGGVFPKQPVYGANNWYYAYGKSSAEEILADTERLVRLTKGLENRPYMVIDDGWQRDRGNGYIGGPWVGNEKFPDMKGLADAIRAKGAIPGIWVRPLLDHREEIPQEARLTHNGALDPSHPYVLEKLRAEIQEICAWGYRLIKHDFTTFDIFGLWGFEMRPRMTRDGWHFYDQSRTSAEIVRELYCTICEAAAPTGTLILGCNTIGHLGVGAMHINRIGDDTSGMLWERSFRLGVNSLAHRAMQHGIFYDVDADCLGITDKIPWSLNRRFGELLAISGTPFFVSAQPGALTDAEEKELAGFLKTASMQEALAEPLDWQENCMPQIWKVGEKTYDFDWYTEEGIRVVDHHSVDWGMLDPEKYFL